MSPVGGVDPRTGRPTGDEISETAPAELMGLLVRAESASKAFAGSDDSVRRRGRQAVRRYNTEPSNFP